MAKHTMFAMAWQSMANDGEKIKYLRKKSLIY